MADELTRQDAADFYRQRQQSAIARTVPGLDQVDPDRAARAVQLGNETGEDASVIYGNLDAFQDQYRQHLIGNMIQNSPYMQGYINAHPLAANISSDDWGNLHNAWSASEKVGGESALTKGIKAYNEYILKPAADWHLKPAKDFATGLWEGWASFPVLRSGTEQFGQKSPAFGLLVDWLNTVSGADNLNRVLAAVVHGSAKAVGGIANRLTGEDEEKVAYNIEGAFTDPAMQMMLMTTPGVDLAAPALEQVGARLQRTAKAVKPYVDANREPPVGVDSVIDHIKGQQAVIDGEALKDAFSAWQKTNTRKRPPEMSVLAARQVVGDAEIGIAADAVRAIYGDKIPAPDDGFLGWVPGIREQLEQSELTGGDIHVPLADWYARTEPEIAKQLHDFVRVRRGGLTLDEMKNLAPIELEDPALVSRMAQQGEEEPTDLRFADLQRRSDYAEMLGRIDQILREAQYLSENTKVRLRREWEWAVRTLDHSDIDERRSNFHWLEDDIRSRQLAMEPRDPVPFTDLRREDFVQRPFEEQLYDPSARAEMEAERRVEQAPGPPGWHRELEAELRDLLGEPEQVQRPPAEPLTGTLNDWHETAQRNGQRNGVEAAREASRLEGRDVHITYSNGQIARIFRNGEQLRGREFIEARDAAVGELTENWQRLPAEHASLGEWMEAGSQYQIPGYPFSNGLSAARHFSAHHGLITRVVSNQGDVIRTYIRGQEVDRNHPAFNRTPDPAEIYEEQIETGQRAAGFGLRTEKYTGKVTVKQSIRSGTFHGFELRGEDGERIGDVDVDYDPSTKNVHIGGISAFGYAYGDPRAYGILGHSKARDIARQLKAFFPESESISGTRVGGARQKARSTGYWQQKFSQPEEVADFLTDMIEGRPYDFDPATGSWIDLDHGLQIKPLEVFNEKRNEVISAVNGVFDKLAPQLLKTTAVESIRQVGETRRKGALYSAYKDRLPFVVWAMDSPYDPVTNARHEVIHHLRQYGFITPEEWTTLRDTAVKERWITKHNITERYRGQGVGTMLEEAIADEFATRLREKIEITDSGRREAVPLTGVEGVFAKIQQLYESLREAIRSALGFKADFKDIFQKIEKGEVGQREAQPIRGAYLPEAGAEAATKHLRITKPETLSQEVNRRLARLAQQDQPELPGVTRMDDRELFSEAQAVGMTKKSYSQLQQAMDAADVENVRYVERKLTKDITRRQTKEWKDQENALRAEIRPNIENRPDIAADRFLSKGILYDQKVTGRPRLNSDLLTDEQKALLDKDYHTKGGINPDDAAALFGFHSGDEMINKLAALREQRGNMGPRQFINHLVEGEVDARMKLQHGDLAQNILDELHEHILSETEFNKLHEETLAEATRLGMEMSLTKEDVKKIARSQFDRMNATRFDVEDFLRNALRSSDLATRNLLDGEPTEAFRQLQRRMYNFWLAREMKQFEKVQKTLDRLEKKYTKREVAGVDAEYKDRIQQLMGRFDMAVQRRPADLAEEMAARGDVGTLEKWVDEKDGGFGALRAMIDDRIFDPAFSKPVKEMTTDEYRALSGAMKVLDKAGRDARKVFREGAAEDLATAVGTAKDQLKENRDFVVPKRYNERSLRKRAQDFKHLIQTGLLNPETWLNRFDRDNLHGFFNQWIVRPLTGSANREASLLREYSTRYRDLGEIKDAKKQIRSPFSDPVTITDDDPVGRPYQNFTMENVAAMVSNVGNEYNREVLFKAHGMDPEQGMAWLAQNAPRELWERAEKLGGIFGRAYEGAKAVYRNIYGEAPASIELKPFSVQLADGTVFESEGWYHPIIRDEEATKSVRRDLGQGDLEAEKGFFPSIANGYTKRRTGKIDILDLTYDAIPNKLTQILHDTAFRAEIIEVAKLLRDGDFKRAITQYAGPQYYQMLDKWVKDIAGAHSTPMGVNQTATRIANYLRTNTISTLIGFNPGTVLKHGFSAVVNSAYEVGPKEFSKIFAQVAPKYFADGVRGLFRHDGEFQDRTLQFIWENSEEIRRRSRNWTESFTGAQQKIEGKAGWRDRMIELGSKPVAISDMLSALPTWLGAYNQEIAAGGTHGDAVFAGDRAVRRAHGSTATTNLPGLMRGPGAINSFLTSLYGFFSTQMQRRAEIAFKLNDFYRFGRQGEIKKAATSLKQAVPLVFAAIIWPTIVEEVVNGIGTDDHRTWLEAIGEGAIQGLASSVIIARDLTQPLTHHGAEPSVGIMSTMFNSVRDLENIALNPSKAFDRAHAGKSIQNLITAAGIGFGRSPTQLGRVVRYGMGLNEGTERGENVPLGLMRGTERLRVVK